ncbi:hypothetical protein MRB53_034941 [Persea americana]|uniref:Uncharacterized protein n=1 Tax=Persea americana TaxID=3435 RepID=A0ACC2K3H8_PERAE|nr:hypothetical protein MRB53_034941 [Persea americana]
MPIGTIIRLTSKESKIGGMSILYESVKVLDVSLLQTKACKKMLLYPKNASEEHCKNLKLNIDDPEPTKYYACSWDCCAKNYGLVSTFYNAQCGWGQSMNTQTVYNQKLNNVACSRDGVFVKGNMRYIIREDLQVFPVSPKATFTLLNDLGISGVSVLEQRNVNVGQAEPSSSNLSITAATSHLHLTAPISYPSSSPSDHLRLTTQALHHHPVFSSPSHHPSRMTHLTHGLAIFIPSSHPHHLRPPQPSCADPSIPGDLSSSLRRSHQHRISSLNPTSSLPALILFTCTGPETSHSSSSPSLSAITVLEPTTHHHLFRRTQPSSSNLSATSSPPSPSTSPSHRQAQENSSPSRDVTPIFTPLSLGHHRAGKLITISFLGYPIPLMPTIAATISVTSLRRPPPATLTLLLRLHPRSAYPHPHPSSSSPSPSPHRPFPSSSRPRLLHHYPVQIHHPTRLIIHLSNHSISPSRRYLSKPSNTSYTRGEN